MSDKEHPGGQDGGSPVAAPWTPTATPLSVQDEPHRTSMTALLVGVIALTLVVGAVAVAVLNQQQAKLGALQPTTPIATPTTASTGVPSTSTAPRTTSPPAKATITPAERRRREQRAAREELEQLADEGISLIDLNGEDAAMIASKWEGIRDPLQTTSRGDHLFHYTDILEEHRRLADEDNLGATVILIRSTDYGKRATSPEGQHLYVTIALNDFTSSEEVASWCEGRFADLDEERRKNTCVPTRLTE
ncbi:hypothetical protein ACFFOM_13700 [Microlunatus capsulatus]|uniref:Uncharacterized protein n=1 Tax=Microlunatus capsulatus TaxID=99117 RepID=A0ABS4Z8Z2_9ACTN|nr:hypothetical protein [Microlunatus capsulatus]MBP2417200.1 hypothetical protein [Microlunatus capsulatus]